MSPTFTTIIRARCGDDEELGGNEIEFRSKGEEACIQRGFDFGLLEGFAVVEIGVGEDTAESSGQ